MGYLYSDGGTKTSAKQGPKGNPITDVELRGTKLIDQRTEADAVSGVVSFDENVDTLEIFNYGPANGTFVVNGISILVPGTNAIAGGGVFKATFGGSPSTDITVTGATTYILTAYE